MRHSGVSFRFRCFWLVLLSAIVFAAGSAALSEPPVLLFSPNSQATAAQSAALDTSGPLTVELFLYQTSDLFGGEATIIRRESPTAPWIFVMRLVTLGGSERLFFQMADTSGGHPNVTGTTEILRNRWTHLACAYDTSTLRCWLDGVPQGSAAVNGPPQLDSSSTVTVGGDGRGFPGPIRDIRLWNRALPESEVQKIAGGGEPDTTNGLVAHWPLRDGSGQIAHDSGPHEIPLFLGVNESLESFEPSWMETKHIQEGPWFETKWIGSTAPASAAGDPIAMDLSGDGRPDFAVIGGPAGSPECTYPYYPPQDQRHAGFRATGDGSFVASSSLIDWEISGLVWHSYQADFTGDGREDVFLAATGPEFFFYNSDCDPPGPGPEDAPGGQARILVRQPDWTLREETASRIPTRVVYDYGTAIGDFDGDGDLDILLLHPIEDTDDGDSVCRSGPFAPGAPCPVILVNDGQGHFTEDFTILPALVSRGIDAKGERWKFWTATAADLDRDGDADIVLARDKPPGLVVLSNDGSGGFTVKTDVFPSQPHHDGPYPGAEWMTVADFDGDGWLDLFEAMGTRGESRLYLNDRAGRFRDASDKLPPGLRNYGSARCDAYDLNQDGAPDILCQVRYTGEPYKIVLGQSPALFFNRGDGTFDQMPQVHPWGYSPVTAVVDADLDGDLDLMGVEPWGDTWVAYQTKRYRNDDLGWYTFPEVPGFELKVEITGGASTRLATPVADCIAETACFAGALADRAEVFVRVVGPKPNGFLWPTLVKFSTSEVDVRIRQLATGIERQYVLPGAAPGVDELPGLFDRSGFAPQASAALESVAPADFDPGLAPAVSAPSPPAGSWLRSPEVPGFETKVRITGGGGPIAGAPEGDCIDETLCVSGALAGRPEVFVRVVGPKPNGRLWPTLVKFSTSEVEIWIRQLSTGAVRYYRLAGARPGFDELPGLFDREGFPP
ncbi:MAG TPA: FG-GAP-like repeat-containing protein [Thermoanaerobaculia bacterium]|nr:FG-GAP-like repeat-containing protein [Thermoanaerobaculia bacterium]